MQVDAELATSSLSAASPWRPVSIVMQGMAVLLTGDRDRAEVILEEAADAAVAGGAIWVGVVASSERALLALDRTDLTQLSPSSLGPVHPRRHAFGRIRDDRDSAGRESEARDRKRARGASPGNARERPAHASDADARAVVVRSAVQLELAKAHLDLSDGRGAATLYQEAAGILRRRPGLGTLVAEAEYVR